MGCRTDTIGTVTRHDETPPAILGDMEPAPVWPPVRHPFQVSTMVAFTAIGIGFYGNPSVSLSTFLNSGWLYAWVTILALSGILGLFASAAAVRHEDMSLLTERIALIGAGAFCFLWTVALAWFNGIVGLGSIIIFAGLTIACAWRLWQVQKRVSWKKRRSPPPEPSPRSPLTRILPRRTR